LLVAFQFDSGSGGLFCAEPYKQLQYLLSPSELKKRGGLMANILKNSTLSGFSPAEFFRDNTGNTGAIEHPNDWEYVFMRLHPEDPNLIPQSLHREKGFCISAGWRKWEAGFVQRGVALKGGQRYLAKAAFLPDVNFGPGEAGNIGAVQWRFWIQGGDDSAAQGWQSTSKGQFKQKEESLFVIEAASDMMVDFYFKAKSDWPDNTCDFNLYSLSLEEVAADYGGANVTRIGEGGTAAPVTQPPTESASGGETAEIQAASVSKALEDVMTADDIVIIVNGLREMRNVTPNQTVLAAFMRLADVLEKLK
jgi:hypothetical protein